MYFFLNVLATQELSYVCTDIRLLSVFVTVRKLTSPHFITRLYKKHTLKILLHHEHFSASVTALPPAWQRPLQRQVRCSRPHVNITSNHSVAWFWQILSISWENGANFVTRISFLQCISGTIAYFSSISCVLYFFISHPPPSLVSCYVEWWAS